MYHFASSSSLAPTWAAFASPPCWDVTSPTDMEKDGITGALLLYDSPPAYPPTSTPSTFTLPPPAPNRHLLFFHVCSTSQLPLISGLTLGPPLSPPVPTSQGLDPFLLPALPYPASTSPLVPPCTLWVCTYPCHKFMQFYPVLYWKCTIKVCSSNNGNLLHFKCWNNLLICGVDFYLGFCPKAKPRSSSHPSQWWWWWVSHI